jgi:hypothetical protein
LTVDELIALPPFGLPEAEKSNLFESSMEEVHRHHVDHCQAYASFIASGACPVPQGDGIAGLPFLPVRLFKTHRLLSVPDDTIQKVLTSSGTTGDVSRIHLDAYTATLQAKALATIMKAVLGPSRLPMLIIDTPSVLHDRRSFSARGAGILGMTTLGRRPRYVLDESMNIDHGQLQDFLHRHGAEPFLMFGFTFMVWQYFYQALIGAGIDLSNGILIHSGGWKKLEEAAVSNDVFKRRLCDTFGLTQIRSFYGMVEQVGSVFLEGDDGLLHCPSFAEVIVRDPKDWSVAPPGQPGVVEVLSVLPWSYPGHALLTEDVGIVYDDGPSVGWHGRRFSILGRLQRSELRGCSDTYAASRQVTSSVSP